MRVVSTGGEGIWLSGAGNVITDCFLQSNGSIRAIEFGGGLIQGTTVTDSPGPGINARGAIIVNSVVRNADGTPISNASGITERSIY